MRLNLERDRIAPARIMPGAARSPKRHRLNPQLLADNLIIGFDQLHEQAHPFRVLRSQLLKHVQATDMKVFAITSVQPDNGKTHVAANLAASLSRLHPTLLIELDLRRPSIGHRLGLDMQHSGVDDFLSGDARWANTAMAIDGFDLTIHRVREPRLNAEELLASSQFQQLIEAIRGASGNPICIIDTPPALVNDDLMLIARAIDGVLMVVEEGHTSKRALMDTITSLSPTPIVGSVLNKSISNPNLTNYYRYPDYARKDAGGS